MSNRKHSGKLVYLTNPVCDSVEDRSELFEKIGLAYTTIHGEFYPLTPSEDRFICENALPIGPHWALIGCSALRNGTKYLAPTIEFGYYNDGDNELDWTKQEAEAAYRAFEPLLQVLAEQTNGYYTLRDEPAAEYGPGDGYFAAELLIPFEYARKASGDLATWCDHLEKIAREHAIKLGLVTEKKVA
ncbi:hypothetical protein [Marinobacter sp. MBR-105]|jgi:hypothetical protein